MSINQQDIINTFFEEIKDSVGEDVGNRIYDTQAPDDITLPCITFNVVTDQDEVLMGDQRILNIFIQVNFFGKKSRNIKRLRIISDKFIQYVDGRKMSNNHIIRIVNKGISVIESVVDQNIMIMTEVQIR